LLQQCIRWVRGVGVFLDGLQEEGIAGDPLHWHHQEETQRSGIDFRPGEKEDGDKLKRKCSNFLCQRETKHIYINLR